MGFAEPVASTSACRAYICSRGRAVGIKTCDILGFNHRLQTQLALCQMQIEANTRCDIARGGAEDQPAIINAA
jgi:hypothetical protein